MAGEHTTKEVENLEEDRKKARTGPDRTKSGKYKNLPAPTEPNFPRQPSDDMTDEEKEEQWEVEQKQKHGDLKSRHVAPNPEDEAEQEETGISGRTRKLQKMQAEGKTSDEMAEVDEQNFTPLATTNTGTDLLAYHLERITSGYTVIPMEGDRNYEGNMEDQRIQAETGVSGRTRRLQAEQDEEREEAIEKGGDKQPEKASKTEETKEEKDRKAELKKVADQREKELKERTDNDRKESDKTKSEMEKQQSQSSKASPAPKKHEPA
jgi:hypothetical protein